MTATENSARIDDIVDNSVKVCDLSTVQKREIFDCLFQEGAKLHYLNPIVTIGDRVYGKAADGLFTDFEFEGTVTALPITEANLQNVVKD
jgi:hypothetical protein